MPLDAGSVRSAPVLVTSGRLAIQKNQAPLLDVFAALLKRQPAKLVFIGDGELRDDLLAMPASWACGCTKPWTGGTADAGVRRVFRGPAAKSVQVHPAGHGFSYFPRPGRASRWPWARP